MREVAAMLKAIHAGEDIVAARQKAVQVIEKMRGLRLANAAELVVTAVEETLAYHAFPEEHWRRIRTNNPLERILREIRRRTRVVGSFPDGQSALNLAAARLRHIAGTAWSTKRYLNIELPKDQQMRGASWLGGGVQPSNRGRLGMFCDASPIWRFLTARGAEDNPERARIAAMASM
jgi:putative transposase